MFISEIWLFDCFFLNSAHLICRSTDISKCLRGSLRLRDNESRLYIKANIMFVMTLNTMSFLSFPVKTPPSFLIQGQITYPVIEKSLTTITD